MTVRGYVGEKYMHLISSAQSSAKDWHIWLLKTAEYSHMPVLRTRQEHHKVWSDNSIQLLASDSLVHHVYLSYTSHSSVQAWAFASIGARRPSSLAPPHPALPPTQSDKTVRYLSPSLDDACSKITLIILRQRRTCSIQPCSTAPENAGRWCG